MMDYYDDTASPIIKTQVFGPHRVVEVNFRLAYWHREDMVRCGNSLCGHTHNSGACATGWWIRCPNCGYYAVVKAMESH